MHKFAKNFMLSASVTVIAFSGGAYAQITPGTKKEEKKPVLLAEQQPYRPAPVAAGSNLYCAGYIQTGPFDTSLEVVGGDEERETRKFELGDYMYVSGGSAAGVEVGNRYSIIRPRGKEHSPFSRKRYLGVFTQEVGMAEVIEVHRDVSVVKITMACEEVLLGDLLKAADGRVSPLGRPEEVMDRFAEPNGKTLGRVVLARDGHEVVAKSQIVYLDLGAEDNVKSGDYLTVFRPLGKRGISPYENKNDASGKDQGYESRTYRNGKFSNQAARKGGTSGTGETVTSDKAKEGRPAGLRKVVGEVIILSVKEKTATAVVTRTIQEVHTGDFVELQ